MKFSIFALSCLLLLTGCPSEKEIQGMMEDLKEKKTIVELAINKGDFSLESLLKIQDFFFGFTEKVHLANVEEDGLKKVKFLIKSGGLKKFCQGFVLPLRQWERLESYCAGSSIYRCSPDIKEYKNTLTKLLTVLGAETTQAFSQEPECN